MMRYIQPVCLVLFFLCLLFLIGTAGGLESGTLTFKQAVTYGGLSLAAMAVLFYVGKLHTADYFEEGDEGFDD